MSARVSLLLGVLAGMLGLAACFGALYWVLAPERFPIRKLELKGNLEKISRAEIEAALPRFAGNFFAVDLAEIRAGVERLPWVRRVEVRRAWPDVLEIEVEEHVALARWADAGLVNTQGEIFKARSKDDLPTFLAPAGSSAEVTRRYRRFAGIVAPLGTPIERVVLTPRLAWQLRLSNGVHLMLGRDADQAEARLRRFVEVHPEVKPQDTVDLRYPNGFALRTREVKSGT